MHWEYKAKIMKFCASFRGGDRLYRLIQKTFGRLKANPMSRLPTQAEMAKWMLKSGREIVGKRFFEVGTGHIPIAPIGWFLCGAESVITVDLHKRMESRLTREALEWIAAHQNEVYALYEGVVDDTVFDQRFAMLKRLQHDPSRFFQQAGLEYQAPLDAANTNLSSETIDCHFSITVLEHIPLSVIREIFIEAKRIVNTAGAFIHFVDLSDHFQHSDHSITRINFLKYSQSEWCRIAGNQFAYCNRLRPNEYLKIFDELGFSVAHKVVTVDEESLAALQMGNVKIHPDFAGLDPVELCSTSLKILLDFKKHVNQRHR